VAEIGWSLPRDAHSRVDCRAFDISSRGCAHVTHERKKRQAARNNIDNNSVVH
jgi:hypothetical protein